MLKHLSLFRWCVFLLAITWSGLAFSASENSPEEKLLRSAIEKFSSAFVKADLKILDKMLTDNYVHTNSGSKPFGKQAWLGWLKTRKQELDNGLLKYDFYKTEELKVYFHGDSAVVTGRNIASGVKGKEPFNIDIRFTHFWVKIEDSWKRAAFHDAKTR
ncbi:nuclear transport factor 2 family protein [Aliikangiella coralliicola]|uniref:Nuclear transport factor 2 family protein n=1 Tax=Aliikangiella coralliicola TaxID=2592383 RepID=A0A545TV19_9GAMM|nr:nuclear transport factor 2 family protein [Aliikangiella coralliicola]TQV81062.1 nuclear transport factor 2 family protein [Aliikangiella coralliicola]